MTDWTDTIGQAADYPVTFFQDNTPEAVGYVQSGAQAVGSGVSNAFTDIGNTISQPFTDLENQLQGFFGNMQTIVLVAGGIIILLLLADN